MSCCISKSKMGCSMDRLMDGAILHIFSVGEREGKVILQEVLVENNGKRGGSKIPFQMTTQRLSI